MIVFSILYYVLTFIRLSLKQINLLLYKMHNITEHFTLEELTYLYTAKTIQHR